MERRERKYEGENLVFIVGAPRSGTTWLQNMLASSPNVITGAETEFFTYYIKKLYDSWYKQKVIDSKTPRGKMGLPFYFDEDRFDEHINNFAANIFRNIIEENQLFIEKTPSHALVVDLIYKTFPKAKFIHMLRDGRDVVASIIAASRSWGSDWAPSTVISASKMWIEHVTLAREKLKVVPKNLWIEVRYEQLSKDTLFVLQKVGKFIGVHLKKEEAKKIVKEFEIRKMKKSRKKLFDYSKEPRGFYRKGKVGSWKKEFNFIEKLILKTYLKPHLKKLGY